MVAVELAQGVAFLGAQQTHRQEEEEEEEEEACASLASPLRGRRFWASSFPLERTKLGGTI